MEKRRLGNSDMEFTVFGLGAWAYGKTDWGEVDDNESIRTIQTAIDIGINFIDTAKGYGSGYSEIIVGKGVKGRRDQVYISSKCGAEPEGIKKDIDECLKRMQLDYIDLYHVHYPNPRIPIADTMGAMAEIQKAGKIRWIGVSNFSIQQLKEAWEAVEFSCCQPPCNVFWREIETDILPFCREHNIGVICYSPLGQGLLTGKFRKPSQIPNDIRSKNKLFQPGVFEKCVEVVELMEGISRRYGKTVGQVALNWVIQQPGVTAAIVGAKHPFQIQEDIGGWGWSLSKQDIEQISQWGLGISKLLDYSSNMWGYKPQ